jgi:hypothetical protein
MMDSFISKFQSVEITRERFGELLTAERDAERLKSMIRQKVERYEALTYTELLVLVDFLCIKEKATAEPDESEEEENG